MAWKVGQTATAKDGRRVQWDGQNWVNAPPVAPTGSAAGSGKFSPQAQNFLGELSKNAASAREVGRLYDRIEGAMGRLQPGPYRGRMFLGPAIPEEGGGWLDIPSAAVIGGIAKVTGALKPSEVTDYQTMRAIQNAAVLERQLPQKGAQTESDAARMMLADVSPNKDTKANQEIIRAGRQKIEREQAKAAFYGRWANRYGYQKTNPQGETADEVWARSQDYIVDRIIHGAPARSRQQGSIKILSRTKVK